MAAHSACHPDLPQPQGLGQAGATWAEDYHTDTSKGSSFGTVVRVVAKGGGQPKCFVARVRGRAQDLVSSEPDRAVALVGRTIVQERLSELLDSVDVMPGAGWAAGVATRKAVMLWSKSVYCVSANSS